MKTVLQRFIEIIEKTHSFPSELKKGWLDMEKEQLRDFWIEGNRQGWEQNTDWPEDADKFYDKKFT